MLVHICLILDADAVVMLTITLYVTACA